MWKEPIKNALAWARRTSELESLDPANYRVSYLSLIRLFSDFVDLAEYETVLSGALAVYGWMPTILKNPPSRQRWQKHSTTLRDLRAAESWKDVDDILDNDPSVLKFVNNSVVGTSKFLHFLNPKLFPIWDSRIARCVGLRHQYQLDNITVYRSYGQAVSEALQAGFNVPQPFLGFMGEVSAVRRLEMLLFLYGKTLSERSRTN